MKHSCLSSRTVTLLINYVSLSLYIHCSVFEYLIEHFSVGREGRSGKGAPHLRFQVLRVTHLFEFFRFEFTEPDVEIFYVYRIYYITCVFLCTVNR